MSTRSKAGARRTLVGAVAALALFPTITSAAQADVKAISVKSVLPGDGATIPATQSVTFQVKTDDPVVGAHLEVATQPTLGRDGTLASEFTLPVAGYIPMTQGDA